CNGPASTLRFHVSSMRSSTIEDQGSCRSSWRPPAIRIASSRSHPASSRRSASSARAGRSPFWSTTSNSRRPWLLRSATSATRRLGMGVDEGSYGRGIETEALRAHPEGRDGPELRPAIHRLDVHCEQPGDVRGAKERLIGLECCSHTLSFYHETGYAYPIFSFQRCITAYLG